MEILDKKKKCGGKLQSRSRKKRYLGYSGRKSNIDINIFVRNTHKHTHIKYIITAQTYYLALTKYCIACQRGGKESVIVNISFNDKYLG